MTKVLWETRYKPLVKLPMIDPVGDSGREIPPVTRSEKAALIATHGVAPRQLELGSSADSRPGAELEEINRIRQLVKDMQDMMPALIRKGKICFDGEGGVAQVLGNFMTDADWAETRWEIYRRKALNSTGGQVAEKCFRNTKIRGPLGDDVSSSKMMKLLYQEKKGESPLTESEEAFLMAGMGEKSLKWLRGNQKSPFYMPEPKVTDVKPTEQFKKIEELTPQQIQIGSDPDLFFKMEDPKSYCKVSDLNSEIKINYYQDASGSTLYGELSSETHFPDDWKQSLIAEDGKTSKPLNVQIFHQTARALREGKYMATDPESGRPSDGQVVSLEDIYRKTDQGYGKPQESVYWKVDDIGGELPKFATGRDTAAAQVPTQTVAPLKIHLKMTDMFLQARELARDRSIPQN